MGIDTTIPIIEQIRWERDMAIEQLSEIGKGLGERMDDVEKVVRCKDCIWYDQEHQSMVFCNSCMCSLWEIFSKPDHFCANGTRRKK